MLVCIGRNGHGKGFFIISGRANTSQGTLTEDTLSRRHMGLTF